MQFTTLFENIAFTGVLPVGEAALVTQDSRRVAENAVFVCTRGLTSDGHDFAANALAAGAKVIVTDHALGIQGEVVVQNTRKAYAELCQRFFDYPSRKLRLVAVTGTNGKTTVTTLIKEIVEKTGHKAGLIGTIHTEIDQLEIPAKYTTPEPWDLAALMARMVSAGCTFAVLEASSQALDQLRLWGLYFEVVVFTNLTQDHLDYHKTFENYYLAKKSLFAQAGTMVVNIDDAYGRRLVSELPHMPTITYSTSDNTADYTARDIRLSAAGVQFVMVGTGFIERMSFPMPGEYSVHNALSAAAAAVALGFSADAVSAALTASVGVRGRCEVLYHGAYTVLCDYAHTGDAIEKVLSGIAPFAENRLLVLFGCAGERDAKKRPLMADAVMRYADFIILTSDNPRKENPYDIIGEITPLLDAGGKPYLAEVERRAALRKALEMLSDGDVLMLLGKGHEDYQVIDGVTLYLDEHRIVADWLKENQR